MADAWGFERGIYERPGAFTSDGEAVEVGGDAFVEAGEVLEFDMGRRHLVGAEAAKN